MPPFLCWIYTVWSWAPEPMIRSTPNEFILFGKGTWHYVNNADNIKQFYFEGVQRAKNFESIYTLGMRGFGDLPLSEPINIQPLEQVLADQSDLQGRVRK
ncbi:hypothetical protein BDQ12DRAFT_688064 [Crucibulum laeve]|uniref:Uncharacterized protein n=1 Tax=Crucibulum laeve TaxID=68775 RepID=A0A5C3LSS8_9AGAR|nr:hypothetical protein BDQ12DRAFT_688064 [Crucibulum laeve]